MAKNTTRDPMYGESKIKGSKGPKSPKDVTLPPLKAKAHPPGKPDAPRPDPSSPWLPGKAPKVAKWKSKYSGKGPASA